MAEQPAPITHRRVLKIAGPIVLSNATVPILGAVDVAVVGQLGAAEPIAAVGLGAIILTTLFWAFGFLRMGTAGMVGQAEGAGDHAEVSALLTRALLIAVAGGGGLILLQMPLFAAALWMSDASAETEAMAHLYLSIRIWTAPFAISVFAFTGWMVAMERSHGVFWTQFVMNGVNIGLDLIFVLGLDWGVGGVAFATVLADLTGAGLGLWFCRDAFARVDWRDWARVFDKVRLVRMMLINTDILIRSLLLMLIFSSFVMLGTRFGDTTLAANEVLMQFMYITAHAMDGFAFAAEALIARAFGRGDVTRLRTSLRMTTFWSVVTCATLALGFALFGPWLIAVMAKDADVQQVAELYLPWMVAAPLVGWLAWILDGVFIGATRSRDMRNMMIVSALIYAASTVVLIPWLGNHGLWLCLLISFIARGITLSLRYPALERAATAEKLGAAA